MNWYTIIIWLLFILAIINIIVAEVYRASYRRFMDDYSAYQRTQTILLFIIAFAVAVSANVITR